MSLIISSAARLKPEVRLAEAISHFERSLSDEQKRSFHDARLKVKGTPPTAGDVMQLTAEINQSHKIGSKCYGPRFTKFLHATQQFAALGDVLVGGSQNIIACGVWSLVRMTLLGLVNHASYIESFSAILMEAGRAVPQNFNLAVLYPRSKELQSYIMEYFIIVVQLCQHFLNHMKKSALRKFASSLNESDLKEYHTKLTSWSKALREEMDLLVARTVQEEATDNSLFRMMMSIATKQAAQQRKVQANQLILDFCTTYDYEASWRQLRKVGTTQLFAKTPEYLSWRNEARSSTLIFEGKLGSGKSVMMANMVDELTRTVSTPSLNGKGLISAQNAPAKIIAFFFCKHDIPESLRARTILGALVRQLIRPFISSLEALELPEASTDMRCLISLLQHVQQAGKNIYVVVDGLDLCEEAEARFVANELHVMRSFFPMRLCISCRLALQGQSSALPSLFPFPETRVILLPDNTAEIEAFIDVELECCLTNRSLVLGDQELILEIQSALLQGSQGMFLWVFLQIKALCAMKTDDEIRKALQQLPRDLSEVYSRILQKSNNTGSPYQKKVMEFILTAKRPLNTEEMREALSVTPGDTTWSASKMLNDVYAVLATCGCLITVDEEELTIRTIHPSVNQFLFESHLDRTEAHTAFTSVMITYLSYGVFGTELATRIPSLEISSAPANIITSTAANFRGGQNLAIKLLRNRKQSKLDANKVLGDQLAPKVSVTATRFVFLDYAKQFTVQHAAMSNMDQSTWKKFWSLIEREIMTVRSHGDFGRLLHHAIELQDPKNIELLIPYVYGLSGRSPSVDADTDYIFRTALARLNEEQICDYISTWKDTRNNHFYVACVALGKEPNTLSCIIEAGKVGVLRHYVESGVSAVNWNHLELAAMRNEVGMLEILSMAYPGTTRQWKDLLILVRKTETLNQDTLDWLERRQSVPSRHPGYFMLADTD